MIRKIGFLFAAVILASPVYAVEPMEDAEMQCMAEAMYFEARREGEEAMANVGWTILNRTESKHYPDTICGVVRQANRDVEGKLIRHQCAFSWYCDGAPDTIHEVAAWNKAKHVATVTVDRWILGAEDPTGGADHYHTPAVSPRWADEDKVTANDGAHIFYDLVKG